MKEFLYQEPKGTTRKNYKLINDGMLMFKDKCYVACVIDLKKLVMDEFHKITYSGHPGY